MNDLPFLAILARWIHIISATLAIGVPIFMRFVLMPIATKTLSPESALQLRQAISARWFKWVNAIIALFILSGLYTFIAVILPLDLGEAKPVYHMIFGFKMILALGIFFLASALAGHAKPFQIFRDKAKVFLGILIAMSLLLVLLSGVLRNIHDNALRQSEKPKASLVVPPPSR